MKKRKILHGMSDVAGQGSYSVRGLRERGEDATLAVWTKNPFGYPADLVLDLEPQSIKHPFRYLKYLLKRYRFARYAMKKYDVFHFHFGDSLLPQRKDLKKLKKRGKKVFMEYHGDDIRYTFYFYLDL